MKLYIFLHEHTFVEWDTGEKLLQVCFFQFSPKVAATLKQFQLCGEIWLCSRIVPPHVQINAFCKTHLQYGPKYGNGKSNSYSSSASFFERTIVCCFIFGDNALQYVRRSQEYSRYKWHSRNGQGFYACQGERFIGVVILFIVQFKNCKNRKS